MSSTINILRYGDPKEITNLLDTTSETMDQGLVTAALANLFSRVHNLEDAEPATKPVYDKKCVDINLSLMYRASDGEGLTASVQDAVSDVPEQVSLEVLGTYGDLNGCESLLDIDLIFSDINTSILRTVAEALVDVLTKILGDDNVSTTYPEDL